MKTQDVTRKSEDTLNVAIVGGGPGCLTIMDMISMDRFRQVQVNLVGIADINPDAPALKRAQSSGIYTTKDYHDLFDIPDLNLILELTGDDDVSYTIQREKPVHMQFMDHTVGRLFFNFVRSEGKRQNAEAAEERLEKEVEERSRELKASEEETRLQKRTAEGIIYGSPTPMFVVNKSHKVIYWNRACEKLTGFRSEEMIGTDRHWAPFFSRKRPLLADVIIDKDSERLKKAAKKMNLRKSPIVEEGYEAEVFVPHLGKEGMHLYLNTAPIKDDAGNMQGAIVTYQDFSEREKMLLEIKRRETFVQNLIHNSIDGIIATESRGTIVIFNRGAVEILGYRPEEIIGRMTYPEILSEETGSAIRNAFYGNQYGPPGKIINMEGNLLNKVSEKIPVRLSGTLIYEEEQEVGSVVFIQDLREIRSLRKEKEQSERMAAIGRTVAGVAHYIKNILTGLKGGAYVINSAISKKDMELTRKGWDMVERNIDQIGHIVTDMLIYSSEREPSYQMVAPNELIMEVMDLMEEKARISGVALIRELQPGLPMVNMDKTGIHRCLLNLIGNAIDACTLEGIIEGQGVVTVKTDSPTGWGISFQVSDNGTGMDGETQKRLFTDFFTTKGYKGSGLGLPVTRKIIEEHGGKLSFESRAGHGTTFTLMLPK